MILTNELDWNQSNQSIHSLMVSQSSPSQFLVPASGSPQNFSYPNQFGYTSSPNAYWQTNGYYNQGSNYANYALALAGYQKMNYSYANYYEGEYGKLSPNTSDVDSTGQQTSLPVGDSGFDSPKVCLEKNELAAASCTPSPKWN